MNNYFRLNPEVYLELGERGAVLYNVLNGNYMAINEEYKEQLIKAEMNEQIEDSELFANLSDIGWGKYYSNPVYVEKLRKYNIFNMKKFWKDAPNIKMCILQLTNACNQECSFCNDVVCPMCITNPHNKETELSLNEWVSVVDQLKFFGAEHIILTGGDISNVTYLNKLIKHIQELNIATSLCVPGASKLEIDSTDVIINILMKDPKEINNIKLNFKKFNNVNLCIYETNAKQLKDINKNWKSMLLQGNSSINKKSLLPVKINRYFDRKLFDVCLNNKITILSNGDVVPCLGASKKVISNVKNEPFSKIVKTLEKDYWEVSISNEEVYQKCSSCEFRYACRVCRFTDTENNCLYDKETMIWR